MINQRRIMNQVILSPYVFFTGNCREAMEFYKNIFGGDLNIMSMKDGGMGDSDKVMHARLKTEDLELLAADGTRTEPYPVSRISLSLMGSDKERLIKYFEQLASDGKITSELKTE